jgi:hypothetical protein
MTKLPMTKFFVFNGCSEDLRRLASLTVAWLWGEGGSSKFQARKHQRNSKAPKE